MKSKFNALILKWHMLDHKHKILITLPNVILPLIIGGLIYVFFKPTTYVSILVYSVFDRMLYINGWVKTDGFVICYMTDCLWAYALFFMLLFIQVENVNKLLLVLFECIAFETLTEILQYVGIFKGTFDLFDIIFEVSSTLVACFIWIMFLLIIQRKNVD